MTKELKIDYKRLVNKLNRFETARILVIGDLMRDIFIWGRVKRISPEAPVPVVEVERETEMLGGAANVVNNLVVLGAKVYLAGVVGDDQVGKGLIGELRAKGVKLEAVISEPNRATTIKTRIIAHSQQVVRFDRENRQRISIQSQNKIIKSIEKIMPKVDLVVISDYAKGVISEQFTSLLFPLVHNYKKKILVDPKPVNLAFYRGADVITPNHIEAGNAVGIEAETDQGVEKAGRILLERLSASAILITRGEQGISLIERNHPARHIPTVAREVYDVTGAGDTVISTLGVALASGLDLYSATILANLAAGIGVGKLGTSVVSREELRQALINGGL